MTHHWDEFSKSLAEESLPRRESLRRLAFLFAGAALSPLGVGTAWARGPDPCKTFCNRCPKSQRTNCLAACNACNRDTSRVCGSCGSYVCCREPGPWEYGACIDGACAYTCAGGADYCDGICTFLGSDPYNCGGCGHVCAQPGPYEYGACVNGNCEYACAEGAVYCNGFCTFLDWDPYNCGACGNVCDESTHCSQGACIDLPPNCIYPFILCDGVCVDPTSNRFNCGGCGVQCASDEACISGFCVSG